MNVERSSGEIVGTDEGEDGVVEDEAGLVQQRGEGGGGGGGGSMRENRV